MSMPEVARRVSAILPLVMSLSALCVVLGHVALFGATREADEGAAAHLFQVLIGGQLPIILFYAAKWLPRSPREAAWVLALHGIAILFALAPVFVLGL